MTLILVIFFIALQWSLSKSNPNLLSSFPKMRLIERAVLSTQSIIFWCFSCHLISSHCLVVSEKWMQQQCRHCPGSRRARAWEQWQREVHTQAAGPGPLVRRARLLSSAIFSPKPLLDVPLQRRIIRSPRLWSRNTDNLKAFKIYFYFLFSLNLLPSKKRESALPVIIWKLCL